jgi:hypothetical protein
MLLVAILPAAPLAAQVQRQYHTPQRIEQMRQNVEQHDWAKSQRNQMLGLAERYAAFSDERLRSLVVPPQVPRAYQVHNDGCPVHGIEVHAQGLYKWIIDVDQPWKITCPVGGEMYPSNDFAAYLASGMRDRSLLTGDYADDGWGWHQPGDTTDANHWFVAYYAHWSMMKFLRDAFISLGQGAVLADDPDKAKLYAHKCGVLLWQLATYYPDYEYSTQSREGKEHNPNYTGKLYNMIWEVYTPQNVAPAYDAVRPFLYDDAELQQLAGLDGAALDAYIRERLLRECARRIMDTSGQIKGNYGMHQQALIDVAVALGDSDIEPTSEQMIQWVIANPDPHTPADMGLRDALENMVYRDGVPMESPGYNLGWSGHLTKMAEKLADYGVNFDDNPRFARMLNWPFDFVVCGAFTPALGDSGDIFTGLALPSRGRANNLYEPPNDQPLEQPDLAVDSHLFPGYGVANLQAGSSDNRTALSLSFSSHPAHSHRDQLNLTIYSHENALLTDIGYPEQTDAFNHKRYGYFGNTIAHNTVTVNARGQTQRAPGVLHAYQPNGFAQFVDASCDSYGDTTDMYRRASMLVEITPTQSFTFDVFYVRGGSQHDLSAHSTQTVIAVDPPLDHVQSQGTLAGEDVPYEQFYDDANLKDRKLGSVSYTGYNGSGFQFFTNVCRGDLRERAIADWRLTEPLAGQPARPWKHIGLRAHIVGDDETLITADGPLQKYDRLPKTVPFLIRRRTGDDLYSRFVTVYEPYRDVTWIDRVEPVNIAPDDGNAASAKVRLTDGRVCYLFHALDPAQRYTLDDRIIVAGHAAVLLLHDSNVQRAMLYGGTELRLGDFKLPGSGYHESRIASIDYATGEVELEDAILDAAARAGQVMLVAPDGFADCLTVRDILAGNRFSIGNEDTLVAGGSVSEVQEDARQIVSPVAGPFAQVGMMMVNSDYRPVGRIVAINGGTYTLDRPITASDFPQAAGDPSPRFAVMMAAVGDAVRLADVAIIEP